MGTYLNELTTEKINRKTIDIDECSTEKILFLINEQDALVALAVRREISNIACAVNLVYESLKNGGRLFYIGTGSSGRLGVLDASECPPTYGTNPEMVQALIAGGDVALRTASESSEDDTVAGAKLIEDHGITRQDIVVGITASGRTPFVISALEAAKAKGVAIIGVTNNHDTKLHKICDVCITPIVGAEVIVGSTRMKSGTAQKLVLNMLTTCTMIKLGKVYGNLMVDLKATNVKLHDRAKRIICHATGVDYKTATKHLEAVEGDTKLAILIIKTGLDVDRGRELLKRYEGRLKEAVSASKNNGLLTSNFNLSNTLNGNGR